jgi:hypothetical protein
VKQLESRNGETIAINKAIKALEKAPSKAEVMAALRSLRHDKVTINH